MEAGANQKQISSGSHTPLKSASEPNKINASTPYDFNAKSLTPYGGLLPVITMLEKLGFPSPVKGAVTSERISPCRGPLPVFAGNRVEGVHRLSTAEPIAVHASDPNPDGHAERDQAAGTIRLLEIRECDAPEFRPANPGDHA
jgi:hypothetical protein